MPCVLINAIASYFNDRGSPLCICSLEAEKCLDSIWHEALLYKLREKLPLHHWLLMYRWYYNLNAVVRWNGECSYSFNVTRGTRQGSMLSPHVFGIFINDLLIDLSTSDHGVRIGSNKFGSFAYAYDINLFSATVPGLQKMIDTFLVYSNTWRFKSSVKKTKCISYRQTILKCEPKWSLGQVPIDNVDNIEILGIIVSSDWKCINQVVSRTLKCCKSYFSPNNVGMPYPGLPVDLKLHLWHTICPPFLTFGLETVYLNTAYGKLESLQGPIVNPLATGSNERVKAFLGLSRYSHHSKLLTALDILSIEESIKLMSVSLMKMISLVNSRVLILSIY